MNESAKTGVLLDGGKAVALCAALGALIGVVAYQGLPGEAVAFSLLLLPFLPIPVTVLTARHGLRVGILAGIVIGSFCTAWAGMTGATVPLLVFLFAAVAGGAAGAGFRAGVGIYRMLLLLLLLYIGVILTWFGAHSLAAGLGPIAALKDFAAAVASQSGDFYRAAGLVTGSGEEVTSQVYDIVLYSMPSLLVICAGMMSLVTVAFARLAFSAVKQAFPGDIIFSELRLHFGFVYMFIVSLALLLVSKGLEGVARVAAEAAGQNLMMLSTVLFFIQGLAIAAWFLRKRKASGIMKTVVYVTLGMLEGIFSIVSFVGIFDVFMDFRKRYGSKNNQGQGTINK